MADPHHRALHPLIAVPSLLPWYLGTTLVAQTVFPMALAWGFAAGYCCYELLHYLFHGTAFPERYAHLGWVRDRQSRTSATT
jgi:hypothetical protein